MKVAGRKNDGAWYRTNKWLRQQPDEIKAIIFGDEEFGTIAGQIMTVLNDLAFQIGTIPNNVGGPLTSGEIGNQYAASGIPRQVWLGKLSLDTYTLVEPGSANGDGVTNTGAVARYIADHTNHWAKIGQEVRKLLAKWQLIMRQQRDIVNLDSNRHLNPGGVADANRAT